MHHNRVYAARVTYLTTRETNKLKPMQAQAVIAATLLRHLHAVVTTGQAWDEHRHPRPPHPTYADDGSLTSSASRRADTSGRPGRAPRGIETHDLVDRHGPPRRRPSTRSHAAGTNPIQLCRDDDGPGKPTKPLAQNASR
jgi:hypothetical protein